MTGCDEAPHAQSSLFRVYRIDRTPTGSAFVYDDGTTYGTTGSDGDLSLMIRNWAATSDMHVDWVRARPFVAPDATLTADAEESL